MLRPFEVVVVPFPYSDRLVEKRRPALVVSHEDLPAVLDRVWVAMITSVPRSSLGDVTLRNLPEAGLSAASTVRASKLATVDTSRVIRTIGRLSPADEAEVRAASAACSGF